MSPIQVQAACESIRSNGRDEQHDDGGGDGDGLVDLKAPVLVRDNEDAAMLGEALTASASHFSGRPRCDLESLELMCRNWLVYGGTTTAASSTGLSSSYSCLPTGLIDFLTTSLSLKHFGLDRCMDASLMQLLLRAVSQNPRVRSVALRHCSTSDDVTEALISCMADSNNSGTCNSNRHYHGSCYNTGCLLSSNMTSFSMTSGDIRNEGLQHLLQNGLKYCISLQSLSLHLGTYASLETMEALRDTIHNLPELSHLKLFLNLRDYFKILAPALVKKQPPQNPYQQAMAGGRDVVEVESLELHGNSLAKDGDMKALVDMVLHDNCNLCHLTLECFRMTQDQVRRLAGHLRDHKHCHLRSLALLDCNMGHPDLPQLWDSLLANESIEKLSLKTSWLRFASALRTATTRSRSSNSRLPAGSAAGNGCCHRYAPMLELICKNKKRLLSLSLSFVGASRDVAFVTDFCNVLLQNTWLQDVSLQDPQPASSTTRDLTVAATAAQLAAQCARICTFVALRNRLFRCMRDLSPSVWPHALARAFMFGGHSNSKNQKQIRAQKEQTQQTQPPRKSWKQDLSISSSLREPNLSAVVCFLQEMNDCCNLFNHSNC